MKKVYICLFTCVTSRAIHLELVNDLTADTFLCCFSRFVSRRGIPSLIVTDNAENAKNAAKRLVALFELQEVVEFENDKGIKWDFNLPKEPWWGGFFERLMKSKQRHPAALTKLTNRRQIDKNQNTAIQPDSRRKFDKSKLFTKILCQLITQAMDSTLM